ncbi:MAG: hypothetical protein ABL907_16575 [Hyphomicrobium sp.]
MATLAVVLATASGGQADWKGNFDVTGVTLPALAQGLWQQGDWHARPDNQSVRFVCTAAERCPVPTAIEIKGVLRTENLPTAFQRGPLSPDELTRQGELNAQRIGSRFLGAVPIKIGGIDGVQMTAASGTEGMAIHYLTTWLGKGDRMLDVKITSPDLALARHLATEVLAPLVQQVFK